jgi:hypothetical protein
VIKVESLGLAARIERLSRVSDNVGRDIRRALATQKRVVKAEAPRAITAVYNLTAARVRKSLKIGEVDASTLSVTLTGGKAGIGLRQYGARALGRKSIGKKGTGFGDRRGYGSGVSVKVLKAGQRERLKHAFIAKGLVFQRASREVKRLPIEVLFGPSVADHLNNPKVFNPLAAAFLRRAREEVNRLIVNALERRG